MKNFLELSPKNRYNYLKGATQEIARLCRINKSKFELMVYGSTTYGFNPVNFGKINDIDLFMIIDHKINIDRFLFDIKKIFGEFIDLKIEHLQKVLSNEWQMCRMYTTFKRVKVGFRIITRKQLSLICSEHGKYLSFKNGAGLGYSRILVDKEWSYKSKRYVRIVLKSETSNVSNKPVTITEQYLFSKKGRLGVFGRKILHSEVIYSKDYRLQNFLNFTLKKHVWMSLRYYPKITNTEIISSIIRSERFSTKFKCNLNRKINDIRNLI